MVKTYLLFPLEYEISHIQGEKDFYMREGG